MIKVIDGAEYIPPEELIIFCNENTTNKNKWELCYPEFNDYYTNAVIGFENQEQAKNFKRYAITKEKEFNISLKDCLLDWLMDVC